MADRIVFASYGNDSIALIQWLKEFSDVVSPTCETHVVYSDTGWASIEWEERVTQGETFARASGFITHRVPSMGMLNLVSKKKAWPRNGMQFCTAALKIMPALELLDKIDPEKNATCFVGVRREESPSRRTWPEFVEESPNHGWRPLWAPLVRMTEMQRNTLVLEAGFGILPHRSMECFPCINSSRADLRLLTEERIAVIEAKEKEMGLSSTGKPKTMFRPNKFGGAVGIREIVKWAWSNRGEYEPPSAGCDSGFCGD
jgi:3'-phosphoadenosine 5'-phosphosulfate sulfotransferase (PAPS reductase)/FAD synthetase